MDILHHSDCWSCNDTEYRFDVFKSFKVPQNKTVNQVYGIVLNDEKDSILSVYNKGGTWILPGGGVEEGETLIATLVREIKEETNRTIKLETVQPVYYQDVYFKSNDKWIYESTQIRYLAYVKDDISFEQDPDEDILKAEWIKIIELTNYIKWGRTTELIQQLLREYLN